jgi:hypothetical protein
VGNFDCQIGCKNASTIKINIFAVPNPSAENATRYEKCFSKSFHSKNQYFKYVFHVFMLANSSDLDNV